MALGALGWQGDTFADVEEELWEDARDARAESETAPPGLAHAAMRRGAHCSLWTRDKVSPAGPPVAPSTSGLLVRQTGSLALALAEAIEAGHPVLAFVPAGALASGGAGADRWIVVLTRTGDDLAVHDPHAAKGPSRVPIAMLLAGLERSRYPVLLEIAPGVDAVR
jgi:hypothetical protein